VISRQGLPRDDTGRCLQMQRPHGRFQVIVDDVGIDHRCRQLCMAQGLLHQADVFGGAVELGNVRNTCHGTHNMNAFELNRSRTRW
jgi:hypothetical protein